MNLKCHNCGHEWDYGGRSRYYATCPTCLYKVKIPDQTIAGSAMQLEEADPSELKGIAKVVADAIEECGQEEEMLIQVLLEIQNRLGWVPREAISETSTQLGVPLERVYQIATYYEALDLAPRARHTIRTCMGTACKVRGSPIIVDMIQHLQGIGPGEITPDFRFKLETVHCLGCCAIGPMMVVDSDYYGHMTPDKVHEVLEDYE